jgi:hypothetical protein
LLNRWTSLFKGPPLVQRYQCGKSLKPAEAHFVRLMVTVYQRRLVDLSWFMKCLNESIAKEANREEDCTGHFWESRFKSQALLTEEAVLSCMAYVDLNPVRARMAETPEASDHTSIRERLAPRFKLAQAIQAQTEQQFLNHFRIPLKPLLQFEEAVRDEPQQGILFSLHDYLDLVDYTGRIIHPTKRGGIADDTPQILQRLGLSSEEWLTEATEFKARYRYNQREYLKQRRRSAA